MKRDRIFINDLSKLESLGFKFFPNDTYSGKGVYRCMEGKAHIRVDEEGFLLLTSLSVAAVMKIAEMAKLGLIEKREQVRKPKFPVMLTEDEYEEFKEWIKNK